MFRNISIKLKLIAIILISLLGLASMLTFVVIKKTKETQIKDKFNQLETIEFTKHSELRKYFTTLKNILINTAQNPQTQLALDAFKTSFNNIKKESQLYPSTVKKDLILDYNINYLNKIDFDLNGIEQRKPTQSYLPKSINGMVAQKIFIVDNPAKVGEKNIMTDNDNYHLTYINNHRLFHPVFNNILKTFNLYDIFLIDLEGNIVYTTFKEKDFATNLITGAYKNTGLARVYKKALKLNPKNIAFDDFKPYEPSYNTPASFISTPIYFDKKIIGVLAFQLPANQLTNIMQFDKQYEKAGLGKTGEAYLVGSDYKMRTNSRFIDDIKDKNIQKLHTTIGLKEIKTSSVIAVMNGETKRTYHIIKDYMGHKVLSVYHLIHPFNKKNITWAIIAEIDEKEVLKPIVNIQKNMIYTTIILLFIFLFLSLSLIHNIINKPLYSFQKSLEHFFLFLQGKEKDTKFLEIKNNDEIGKMSHAINEGVISIKKTFKKEKEQLWEKEGVAKLNQLFIQSNNINDISNNILEFLEEYIKNINVGVIYLYNPDTKQLIQKSTYSYTITKESKSIYNLQEGIVGQVGFKKSEILMINNVAQNTDMVIQSGLKKTIPSSTYTFALVYNDILYGVIELGAINNLKEYEIEFLRTSSKIIAIAISTATKNNEVKILLEKSNQINKDLNQKQKEIEYANKKMQTQQKQLEISNTNLEEQQQQLEEANASMEEQQQKLEIQNKELNIAQEEVEQKAKDLEQSNKYKTEFMANMSHELRTPLNAVILLSELMANNKNNNLTTDDIKKAQTINTAGKDLLRLIDDILDLSKVEAGKIEIIIDEFQPSTLLKELQDLYEQSAINKDLEFNINDSYKDTIYSDKHRISQILKNLISNALKFTKKGSIDVSISKNNDEKLPIKISVKDTGIGIPKDKLNKIFEAFTQADGSTSRQYGGTGLGLSITKELTELLGGKVVLESIENQGSKFTILLPNLSLKNNETTNTEEPTQEYIPNEIEIPNNFNEEDNENLIIDDINLEGINVLVVDDDIKNIFVLDDILQECNANVYTAYNGEEALETLEQNDDINIVLMDIMMPVMDGFEAIKAIRENTKTNNIPIIAVTAKTLKEDKDRCIELGANDYITKPINMESLINIIQVWIQKS